jgi:hypothetical protein
MDLTMGQRRAVTCKLAQEYRGADRKSKGRILDTLVEVTGYNRCYAGWLLRHWGRKYVVKIEGQMVELVVGAVKPRVPRKRPRRYDEGVQRVLKHIWESFDFMCGQRLASMLKESLPLMVGSGEIRCRPRTYEKLMSISGATIDRLLRAEKARRRLRGSTHTKPTSLLKAQIPILTWSDLCVTQPGHYQMDLVGHDGGISRGEYGFSLDCIELYSGWSEPRALVNKAHLWVCSAAEEIRQVVPVPIQSLHTDCGGEFINTRLLAWCQKHHIQFRRGRPYRRNDTCYVEQKNFNLIRQAVGYARFDTPEELEVMGELYRQLRLLVNHFYPSTKLVDKHREDGRFIKRYDTPKSPYRRLLECPSLEETVKESLREEHRRLRPLALKRRITELQEKLYRLARAKYSPATGPVPMTESTKAKEVPVLVDSQG